MMERIRALLVDDLRSTWKLWSVWFHTASTLVIGALLLTPSMPDQVQALIPAPYRAAAIAVWWLGGYFLRAAKQSGGQSNG